MELLQLHYFKKVAELEHMTHAAEALNIAQPSLSKAISRLEEDLGVKLFERYNRQIKLNENGRMFLRRVDAVLHELQEARRELNETNQKADHTIRLSVTIPRVLPDLISGFLREESQVHFKQYVQSVPLMTEKLRSGELDFCISSVPIQAEDIEWQPLMTEEILLIAPPGHWLETKSHISLYELRNEAFISMNEGYGIRNLTDKYCQLAGFQPHIAFEGDEPGVIGELVNKGLGIAFIPSVSLIGNKTSHLPVIRLQDPICERTIGLAWSTRRYLSPVAERFQGFLSDYFEALEKELRKTAALLSSEL
ncbi:LysR family transcriptional regulator [Virgibacillus sp. 7505]|uniref:LysR substrate-binding domain-containing protein n=1 Tax=Virgibacillus sp. 7505 TaxID=2022548 RepID=UPI000BA5D64B|nr:LysR substrate-binding domain-containing protein [Virgibacillus sp. 7505]PAE17869.1 LysR family transcriptional regulator [Virgibacillus sp. 7505]